MSTASIEDGNAAEMTLYAASVLRGWTPLHVWSRRRRAAVGVAVASLACVLTALACVNTDIAGAAAAKAALAAARRELADSERAQRALPALTRAAADAHRESRPGGNSADDAREVSELAAASRISLISLAPDTSRANGTSGGEAVHVLKVAAQGDFSQVRSFLRRLSHAPVLIVPGDTTIRRNGRQLALAATLSVFDALPSPPAITAESDAAESADPFAASGEDGAGTGDGLRLAGLIHDRTHAIALIETPHGTDAVERGGTVEGQQVIRIGMPEVMLATGSGTRALKWTEDAP